MKIFFDTTVLVAEALLGRGAQRMVEATRKARWRMYTSRYVLDELTRVVCDDFDFSKRLASLTRKRILRRSVLVRLQSSASMPDDPADSPILQAALSCGADFLVTNDRHLLSLDPCQGMRIISMDSYFDLLVDEGLIR